MMKDTIIYELTTDEFNDAVVKNNYIENSTEQYIGYEGNLDTVFADTAPFLVIIGGDTCCLQFWFDDPAFFESMFTNVRQGDIILCQDGNYTDYINKIYGAFRRI